MRKPIKIKDPLYGYIEITDSKIYSVINSAEFHRLQDIIQTSYSSVYPTSLHNRFIHSIGVYYLGKLAVCGLKNNSDMADSDFDGLSDCFLMACLLHDLGHAPFSHTGEYFYEAQKKDGMSLPRRELCDLLDDEFREDYKEIQAGAPHEVMSALEGLKIFGNYISADYKSFFARCIIGLKYKNPSDVKNCFIELLNSKTIDVDKLDYLLRDSYYSGFKTVNIDYQRLLGACCIIEQSGKIQLGFTKAALSTLESVILAHDMERKLVQNHPTIQYENQLVKHILQVVINKNKEDGAELFSLRALTEQGLQANGKVVRLLSDSDIITEAKSKYDEDELVREYFNRGLRRKALWKSESEYRILFEQGSLSIDAVKELEDKFDSILKIFDLKNEFPLINENLIEYISSEIRKTENMSAGLVDSGVKAIKIKQFTDLRELVIQIKNFSAEHKYEFNYSLISNLQFLSSFNKSELQKILIKFDDNIINELGKTINLFEQPNKPREKFFYIYASPKDRDNFDVIGFKDMLLKYTFDHYSR